VNCPNCGGTTFYVDESHGAANGKWGVGEKYICIHCGFKGSKELMTKGNIRRTYSRG